MTDPTPPYPGLEFAHDPLPPIHRRTPSFSGGRPAVAWERLLHPVRSEPAPIRIFSFPTKRAAQDRAALIIRRLRDQVPLEDWATHVRGLGTPDSDGVFPKYGLWIHYRGTITEQERAKREKARAEHAARIKKGMERSQADPPPAAPTPTPALSPPSASPADRLKAATGSSD